MFIRSRNFPAATERAWVHAASEIADLPEEIRSSHVKGEKNIAVLKITKEFRAKSDSNNKKGTAALSFQVRPREILQYFISLFPSLKSNSWHLKAIWSRSMGLTPVVICLTALGDGQVRYVRACVWVCLCVCGQYGCM